MSSKSENINKLKVLVEELTIRDTYTFRRKDTLEAILDASSDGLWEWDMVLDTAFLSPNYKLQLGYQDHELPNTPQTWSDLMLDDDLIKMNCELKKHIDSNGEYPFRIVVRYNHKDGYEVRILCRGKVIEWNDNGEPIKMVGMHIDLTNL
jgi:two-component system, sensor histidine kinase and response regulator